MQRRSSIFYGFVIGLSYLHLLPVSHQQKRSYHPLFQPSPAQSQSTITKSEDQLNGSTQKCRLVFSKMSIVRVHNNQNMKAETHLGFLNDPALGFVFHFNCRSQNICSKKKKNEAISLIQRYLGKEQGVCTLKLTLLKSQPIVLQNCSNCDNCSDCCNRSNYRNQKSDDYECCETKSN